MHTYRRLASTATSTSRSASTSVHHSATHNSTTSTTTRISRSSSTAANTSTNSSTTSSTNSSSSSMAPSSVSSASASSATPLADGYAYGYYHHHHHHHHGTGMNIAIPSGISRSLASPSGSVSSNGRSSSSVSIGSPSQESYTRAELQTIAESLLAHVSFGPYHIACSPVPTSHIRQHLASSSSTTSMREATPSSTSYSNYQLDKENLQGTTSALNPSNLLSSSSSSSIYNPVLLGPSARRQFEGKEGSHHPAVSNLTLRLSNMGLTADSSATSTPTTHHPRARFTIGGGEAERGRGMGRKSGISTRREVSSQAARGFERDSRGRRGGVKELS